MSHIKRVGFACKFSILDSKHGFVSVPEYNCKTTTIAWLNRQSKSVAHDRLMDIAKHNVQSIKNVLTHLSTLPESLRMFRISSDLLPAFTHDSYIPFYTDSQNQKLLEKWFSEAGSLAKKHNIRLSFHPDQFVVLASDRPEVVNSSIREFEYHATIAKWMGYGQTFQDFKCNVHIGGRLGPQGIRNIYNRLSVEARNILTLENEEYTHGLDDCLSVSDLFPTVLDIHHNWIREGEYIQADDDRIKKVIDSWRGVRPTIHYSVSREDLLVNHRVDVLPDHNQLTIDGFKKAKLRAHSDYMWSDAVNDWAKTHWEWADVLVEAKSKNLASFKLYESWVS